MNRRYFIKASSLLGGGLLLSISAAAANNSTPSFRIKAKAELGPFLEILPNGEILFQFVKHEMGQGISTSMAMILSEELCADWNKVKIMFPDVDMEKYQNPDNGGHDTGGSVTIIYQWDMLRRAGAAAKSMLVDAAARRWNVPAAECDAQEHLVIHKTSGRKLAFGELADEAAQLPVPKTPTLKDANAFSLIGKRLPSKTSLDIVNASVKYGIDQKIPGMLYAVIARSPVFRGKLIKYDAAEAVAIKGVRKIIPTTKIAGEKNTLSHMIFAMVSPL